MRVGLIPAAAAVAVGVLPPAAAAAERGQRVPVQRPQVSVRAPRPSTPHALRFHPTNPRALAAIKHRLDRRRQAAAESPFSAEPKVAIFSGLNKGGLSAGESGGFTPPDTTGSIGPGHYVEMVNDAVAVFGRSNLSRLAGPVDLETFMQAPTNGPGTGDDTVISDPQIQWDQRSGHWYYLATAFVEDSFGDVTGPNYLVFGFSKTSDPSNLAASAWCHYSLSSGGSSGNYQFDDYPKLGHDDLHLIFGSNVFTESSSDLATARIVSVPKPPSGSLSSCPAIGSATRFGSVSSPLRTSDGNKVATPVPSNTANASGADYVVAADDPLESGNQGPKNQIMVWHVGGSAGAPVLVGNGSINVGTYDVPPSAFEGAGVSPTLDTLDGRLTMAVAQRDPSSGREAVWTEHTINTGTSDSPEPGMRWYELLPSSLSAQQGTISNPDPNIDDYNGAHSPGANGELTVFNYNESSLTTTPQIRTRARGWAAPAGASGGELLLGTSGAPASDDSCALGGGVCRWGDYSGASPDQSNAYVVWGSNQAVAAPGGPTPTWTTRNFAIGDSPPTAGFSVATTHPQAYLPTSFSGTASDPDGRIVAFQWDLDGNGSFGDASGSVIHPVFHRLGLRTVAMRAVDDIGLAAVVRHTIRVIDTIPPRLRVAVRRRQRARKVLRHRLPFRVRASEPVRVLSRLVVGRRTAIRLGLLSRRSHRRRVTIGQRTFRVRVPDRTKRVRIKLRRRARRAIRNAGGNVVAQLRVRARDSAGNHSRLVRRRVVLVR